MNMDKAQILKDLQEISVLLYELFCYDLKNQNLTEDQLIHNPQSFLFNQKPIEKILINDSEFIRNFLKDKMELPHD
jgi:hypothetical protein